MALRLKDTLRALSEVMLAGSGLAATSPQPQIKITCRVRPTFVHPSAYDDMDGALSGCRGAAV